MVTFKVMSFFSLARSCCNTTNCCSLVNIEALDVTKLYMHHNNVCESGIALLFQLHEGCADFSKDRFLRGLQ